MTWEAEAVARREAAGRIEVAFADHGSRVVRNDWLNDVRCALKVDSSLPANVRVVGGPHAGAVGVVHYSTFYGSTMGGMLRFRLAGVTEPSGSMFYTNTRWLLVVR